MSGVQSLASTLKFEPNGRITLPANAHYKTPEFVFNNIGLPAILAFIRPIEASSPAATFRIAMQRIMRRPSRMEG